LHAPAKASKPLIKIVRTWSYIYFLSSFSTISGVHFSRKASPRLRRIKRSSYQNGSPTER